VVERYIDPVLPFIPLMFSARGCVLFIRALLFVKKFSHGGLKEDGISGKAGLCLKT
jgi:hypothetical protein